MASPIVWSVRLSVFYGALFLIFGTHVSYMSVWLDSRGLSPATIAFATSVPMLLRIGTAPMLAFVADRNGWHRQMIIVAAASVLAAIVALSATRSIAAVVALVILMQIAMQTIMPMTDAVTMSAVKRFDLDYGRIRLWGSVTFIVAGYAAGYLVETHGPEAMLVLSIGGAALVTAAALFLPRPDPGARVTKLTVADALALARDRHFLLFLAACGAISGSHAILYVFGVLHWRGQGLSASFIATLWAISVVAEIGLFWGARWLVTAGALQLLLLGGIAGLVRWTAMAFDPSPVMLVPLQILHAGTFAAAHLGAMHWIASRTPSGTGATAQALLSIATAGIGMGGAMLISGPLYAAHAGRAYLAMAMLCALGLAIGLWLALTDRGQARSG